MLHTKFRGNRPISSGEEDFWKVYIIYGLGGHLGHVKVCIPVPKQMKVKSAFFTAAITLAES